MRSVWGLIVLLFLATLGDHYTTWACLHEPVPGWHVVEANPIARYLFSIAGLNLGLAIDTTVTFFVLLWLGHTSVFSTKTKIIGLSIGVLLTTFAVVNNYMGMIRMGIA